MRKNYVAAFIEADKAILVTDLKADDKNFQFFIKPGLDKMQVKEILFLNWKQDTIANSLVKKDNQIIFNNYRILLIDTTLNYKKIEYKPKFEAIWIHENPKIKISNLIEQVKFSTLLIDASNKDYKIEQYKAEANKIHITPYILKKNNSYLIDLNLKANHD